jgi:aldose 1-epimerase
MERTGVSSASLPASSTSRSEPPTGVQYRLDRDGQRAVVTEVGAGLRSWRVDGREQLDTFPLAEAGDGYRGKVLAPWPNRLREGRYVFDGVEHRTPVTEPETGSALHGLVLWVNWRAITHETDRVRMRYVLHPQPGYPFTLDLDVEYALVAEGLAVSLRATNLGAGRAPFGAGFHPYLTLGGGRIDDCVLQLPSAGDFRRGHRIGALALDTCFEALDRDPDGIARVRLAAPSSGQGVTLWMDEGFRYAHVYTADTVLDPARRRGGIAIEPMTCAPDAFNSGEGLAVIEPGGSFSARWGLTATAPRKGARWTGT